MAMSTGIGIFSCVLLTGNALMRNAAAQEMPRAAGIDSCVVSALYRSATRPVSLTTVAARKPPHLFDYGRFRMEIAARKAPLE